MGASEILAVLPPGMVILVLLAGLFVALRRGTLRTDREVRDVVETRDMWREAYEAERSARAEDSAAVHETLELARLIADLLGALRRADRR